MTTACPGGHPLVMLSHEYWKSRFAADLHIVGKTVVINGNSMTASAWLSQDLTAWS